MVDNESSLINLYAEYPLTYLSLSDLYTYEILILCIYGVMIIFSFFTNSFAIIIFTFGRRSRSELSPFLLNLSVFNIIMTVYCMPFTITSVIFQRWLYARALCKVLDLFKTFSVTGVLLTLIIIAIDRYCAVKYPLTVKLYSGQKRNMIALLIIWILSIGMAIVWSPARSLPVDQNRLWVNSRTMFKNYINSIENISEVSKSDYLLRDLNYTIIMTTQCVPNKTERPTEVRRLILNFLQTYFVPLSILGFVYLRIAAMLWHRSNEENNYRDATIRRKTIFTHESQQFKQKLKQGIKMLVAVVILYAILWLPMNVFQLCLNLLCDATTSYQAFCAHDTLLKLLYTGSHFLTVSNTAINPIIYGFANNRFRSDIRQIKNRLCNYRRGKLLYLQTNFEHDRSYGNENRRRDTRGSQNLMNGDRKSYHLQQLSMTDQKQTKTANTSVTKPKEHIGIL